MSAEPVLTLEKASAIVAPIYEPQRASKSGRREPRPSSRQASIPCLARPKATASVGDQRSTRFKVLGRIIPDLHWAIREIQVAGDEIIVRGEATGTRGAASSVFSHRGELQKLCRSTYISSKMQGRENVSRRKLDSRGSVNLRQIIARLGVRNPDEPPRTALISNTPPGLENHSGVI